MLGSKIGLGSPLGVIFRPSWAQEPIKTPKGEAPEPIKTPKSEEMSFQERPRASSRHVPSTGALPRRQRLDVGCEPGGRHGNLAPTTNAVVVPSLGIVFPC